MTTYETGWECDVPDPAVTAAASARRWIARHLDRVVAHTPSRDLYDYGYDYEEVR